jgi:hypothetical protein
LYLTITSNLNVYAKDAIEISKLDISIANSIANEKGLESSTIGKASSVET